MADETTSNYHLPLPKGGDPQTGGHTLAQDVLRLRRALQGVDLVLATLADAIANAPTNDDINAALAGVTKSSLGLANVDNVSATDLRNRETHTGQQPVASIAGLSAALDGLNAALAGKSNALIEHGTITANTSAMAGRMYDCDTSSGPFELTLPDEPAIGDCVGVRDAARTFNSNPLTLVRNGHPIESIAENCEIDRFWRGVLVYRGATAGWCFQ